MVFAENNHMVKTLPADGTDQSFDERILPRTSGRCDHFLDLHSCHSSPKFFAVNLVTISKQEPGAVSSGKASMICCAVQAAVGCSVTLKCSTRRRSWASTTNT